MESESPLYEQIFQQVSGLILGGTLVAGTALPSVRALATHLSCSVITTRRAYADLEAAGLIISRQGIGTLVADVPQDRRASQMLAPVRESLKQAIKRGRAVGLSNDDLSSIFRDVLEDS